MQRRSLFIPTLILGKILLIFLVLYFNLGMFGFDSYIHLQYIDAIIENKHIFEFSIAPSYYDFPGLHVLVSGISLMTGMNTEILYEFISIIIPILIFDLTIIAFIRYTEKKKNGYISNNMKSQYLALILLYPSMIGIQMILGRPNSLGISLFSLCLYLYLCKPQSFRANLIASSLAIVTVKVHHMSAIFLVPVIIFVSLFLAKNDASIISFIYVIPVGVIVNTVLKSNEFENIKNYMISKNPDIESLFNIYTNLWYILFAVWIFLSINIYFSRKIFEKENIKPFNNFICEIRKIKFLGNINYKLRTFFTSKITQKVIIGLIVLLQIIGLFIYSASLSSWFVTVELVIIFLLSGLSLISNKKMRLPLFALGLFFYGMTVLFSIIFSSDPELSWVAPRTFVFAIIIVSVLAFLAVSDWIPKVKIHWRAVLLGILLFNTYLSMAYVGKQYLPSYNLTNSYQNLTIANSMDSIIDFDVSRASIPFSVAKFIDGINIYSLPIIISPTFTMVENGHHLTHTFLNYIMIGTVMDQWLGLPYHLTQDELMYLLNFSYTGDLSYHLIINNDKNFLLYNLWLW
ncbi:hypothetical protein EU534_01440 [Candidatus Heimdallarchaeota archaeon]|nr:MAG: hypothetical protein EU534_01440 [Candidatus Heimdallarchaeota archaeon]